MESIYKMRYFLTGTLLFFILDKIINFIVQEMFYLATKGPDVAVGRVLLAQKWSREQEAASEESS
jgi:lipoprotein signal peptidase